MRKNSFTRKEHLKKNDSIKHVFDKGTSFRSRSTHIYLLKRNAGPHVNRVAFLIRKKLYNKKIVLRNRFRRVLKEAYRKAKHFLPAGYDILILATNIKKHTKSYLIEKEMADVFKKYSKE